MQALNCRNPGDGETAKQTILMTYKLPNTQPSKREKNTPHSTQKAQNTSPTQTKVPSRKVKDNDKTMRLLQLLNTPEILGT